MTRPQFAPKSKNKKKHKDKNVGKAQSTFSFFSKNSKKQEKDVREHQSPRKLPHASFFVHKNQKTQNASQGPNFPPMPRSSGLSLRAYPTEMFAQVPTLNQLANKKSPREEQSGPSEWIVGKRPAKRKFSEKKRPIQSKKRKEDEELQLPEITVQDQFGKITPRRRFSVLDIYDDLQNTENADLTPALQKEIEQQIKVELAMAMVEFKQSFGCSFESYTSSLLPPSKAPSGDSETFTAEDNLKILEKFMWIEQEQLVIPNIQHGSKMSNSSNSTDEIPEIPSREDKSYITELQKKLIVDQKTGDKHNALEKLKTQYFDDLSSKLRRAELKYEKKRSDIERWEEDLIAETAKMEEKYSKLHAKWDKKYSALKKEQQEKEEAYGTLCSNIDEAEKKMKSFTDCTKELAEICVKISRSTDKMITSVFCLRFAENSSAEQKLEYTQGELAELMEKQQNMEQLIFTSQRILDKADAIKGSIEYMEKNMYDLQRQENELNTQVHERRNELKIMEATLKEVRLNLSDYETRSALKRKTNANVEKLLDAEIKKKEDELESLKMRINIEQGGIHLENLKMHERDMRLNALRGSQSASSIPAQISAAYKRSYLLGSSKYEGKELVYE